jgi:hypothetical protein
MAVAGPEHERFLKTESVEIQDEPSEFACPYFGVGRWSCPSTCPNVDAALRNLYVTDKDAAAQCRIVSNPPDDYLLENLGNIGVDSRQPYQPKFKSLPLRIISEN